MKPSFRLLLPFALSACSTAFAAEDLLELIDPGVPPGGYTGITLTLPVKYTFMTSSDGRAWTAEEKQGARDSLVYLGSFLAYQHAFVEEPGPDDFTLRWAGADLFKNWAEPYTDTNGNGKYDPGEPFTDQNGNNVRDWDGWDYSNAAAMAVKPRSPGSTPWDEKTYPYNEIYFNNAKPGWHFDWTTNPPAGKLDFPTIAIHETIHMLCVDGHAPHPDEVMYAYISRGERKTLKESDLRLLLGYRVPDAVSTARLLLLSLLGLAVAVSLARPRAAHGKVQSSRFTVQS